MKEYLLFTSAGDSFNLLNGDYNNWNSHPTSNFDVYLVFYGDNTELSNSLKNKVDYFLGNKGGKFQNLVEAYTLDRELFKKYKYIFVLDNDIEINTLEINFMFNLAKLYNFDIIQPSLTDCENCRIDHWLMKNCRGLFASKVSFIEVNMPLFKGEILINFLDYLIELNKPILSGYGMDHVYLNFSNKVYKPEVKKTYAIIHGIDVINPRAEVREIDIYEPIDSRIANYEKLRIELNLEHVKNIEYEYAYDCLDELKEDYNTLKEYKKYNYFYTSFDTSKNKLLKSEFKVRKPLYWNELMFCQKIKYYSYFLNEHYAKYVDKIEVKNIVKDLSKNISTSYSSSNDTITGINTASVRKYMKSFDDINAEDIKEDCIIKTSHASGWNVVINETNRNDLQGIINKLSTYNRRFVHPHEKQYSYIEPRFYIEELIDDKYYGKNGNALVYMIRCIYGKAICVNVKLDVRQNYYNLDWTQFYKQELEDYDKPKYLDHMIKLAETLSQPFEFVRMDFYIDKNDLIYFSEYTFTPAAGTKVFSDELEMSLGSSWTI